MKNEGIDISGFELCCPTTAEVRDAKDFKPYIEASLKEYSKIMGLELVVNNRYDDRY